MKDEILKQILTEQQKTNALLQVIASNKEQKEEGIHLDAIKVRELLDQKGGEIQYLKERSKHIGQIRTKMKNQIKDEYLD